jgi:3-hydroxymyristoyl/3-hydroxydecanoyl-(acyl carrier protein) dehydratase
MWPDKRAIPLENADPNDPYFFKGFRDKFVFPVVFRRNAAGKVEGLSMGSSKLYKRHYRESLLFKRNSLMSGVAGGLLAVILSRALRRK